MFIELTVILVSATLFKCGLIFLGNHSIQNKKTITYGLVLSDLSKLYLVPIIGNLLSIKHNVRDKRVNSLINLLLEIAVVLSVIVLFYQGGLLFDLIFKLFWISIFLSLALIDLNSRKLPNRFIFPLIFILIFLIPFWNVMSFERNLLGFSGYMGSIINTSLISIALTVFGMGIYYSYPSFVGGGDIKLVVIIGLFFGFPDSLIVIYLSIMIGALVSIIKMVIDKNIRSVTIPFGTILSLSSIIAILSHNQLRHVYAFIDSG